MSHSHAHKHTYRILTIAQPQLLLEYKKQTNKNKPSGHQPWNRLGVLKYSLTSLWPPHPWFLFWPVDTGSTLKRFWQCYDLVTLVIKLLQIGFDQTCFNPWISCPFFFAFNTLLGQVLPNTLQLLTWTLWRNQVLHNLYWYRYYQNGS